MNSKYIVKNIVSGLFFLAGSGFVADQKTATVMSEDKLTVVLGAAYDMGINAEAVDAPNVSFGVNYIRQGDVNADGSISANKRNPSKRRFATRDEANQHGSRFGERKAKAGDAAGTAGHIGYWVSETNDPVNAEINWKTGLTNAIEG